MIIYSLTFLTFVSSFIGCSGSDRKDFYTQLTRNNSTGKKEPNPIYSLYLMKAKYRGKRILFNKRRVFIEKIKPTPTDTDVRSFADDIVDLLRKKLLAKRSIQLTHDSLDFFAYAKWVSLNNTANSNAQANASYALESEIIPELQAIFREYLDEVKLKRIEAAIVRYDHNNAKPNVNTLTTDGKQLLKDILNANSAPGTNQTKLALNKAINDLLRNTLGWKTVPIYLDIRDFGFGSSDFSVGEFKKPLSVKNLCELIIADSYNVSIQAPVNSINWLNELLKVPNFYDILHTKRPNVNFSKGITDLVDKTKNYRNMRFSTLKHSEQNTIKRLNRFLLEETYPQKTPKICKLASYNNANAQGAFYQWIKKTISFENECFGDFMNRIIDEKPWYRSP